MFALERPAKEHQGDKTPFLPVYSQDVLPSLQLIIFLAQLSLLFLSLFVCVCVHACHVCVRVHACLTHCAFYGVYSNTHTQPLCCEHAYSREDAFFFFLHVHYKLSLIHSSQHLTAKHRTSLPPSPQINNALAFSSLTVGSKCLT